MISLIVVLLSSMGILVKFSSYEIEYLHGQVCIGGPYSRCPLT
jgi:hypothetical protein